MVGDSLTWDSFGMGTQLVSYEHQLEQFFY